MSSEVVSRKYEQEETEKTENFASLGLDKSRFVELPCVSVKQFPLGLSINFHETKVTDGVYRLILAERTYDFLCSLCFLLFGHYSVVHDT